jgi:hypothetical protein
MLACPALFGAVTRMSGLPTISDVARVFADGREVPILLQNDFERPLLRILFHRLFAATFATVSAIRRHRIVERAAL